MKVAIHQPNFFPYPGFFHKLALSDTFVLMDNTQYDKKFTNRNRIIIPNGWIWLTVPINKKQKFLANRLIEINNNLKWKKEHLIKLEKSYNKSKYYKDYKKYFEKIYATDWNTLFELNYETLNMVINLLGIKIDVIKESELNIKEKSTERLISICKDVGADTYVSGIGGKDYMDEKLFSKNNINLEYQNYTSIKYCQHLSDDFIPDLSIIDLLSNVGNNSLKAILGEPY